MVTTSQEFKAAREKLGLSVNDLSFIIDTNPRTIIKWETDSDVRSPNPVACRIMEWMLGGYYPPEWHKLFNEIYDIDDIQPGNTRAN